MLYFYVKIAQRQSQLLHLSKLQYFQMMPKLRNYSYTSELEAAVKNSKWTDSVTTNITKNPQILDRDSPLSLNKFDLKHSLCCLQEFQSTLYYFFVSQQKGKGKDGEFEFNITMTLFKKIDGQHDKKTFKGFKGAPTCITSGILVTFQRNKNNNQAQVFYRLVLLIGISQGFIKVVELNHDEGHITPIISSNKIEHKSIISIVAADKDYYNKKNISFILLQDSKIFIFNYLTKQVLAIYRPPILSHDFAVCMTIHKSGDYIATCTKSGQIYFWELNEQTLKAIEKSQNPSSKSQQQMIKGASQWEFSIKDKVINVFPMYAIHSATMNGLKWIGFHGNLLATISRKGLFKIIAINFQMKDQFINLIEYQIQNGQSISSVQLFSNQQKIIVSKSKYYITLLMDDEIEEKKNDGEILKWRQNQLKKYDYNSKMNINCLAPSQIQESLIQIIKFNGELRIENVKRIKFQNITNNKRFNHDYAIINKWGSSIILAGNQSAFCIGRFDQQ